MIQEYYSLSSLPLLIRKNQEPKGDSELKLGGLEQPLGASEVRGQVCPDSEKPGQGLT